MCVCATATSGDSTNADNLFAFGSTILPMLGAKKEYMGSEKRQKTMIVRVRVTPQEWQTIEELADSCSLSIPELMRRMALSYIPKSTLDAQAIVKLAEINGDLGRVVGVLKLWLSTESKKKEAFNCEVPKLINDIKSLKDLLREKTMQL